LEEWFQAGLLCEITEVSKDGVDTRAWFASRAGQSLFLKLYPNHLVDTWAANEIAIAGGNLHPAIVPLRETAPCQEGLLLVYDRVDGENLGPMSPRGRFHALPLVERITAVSEVMAALAAIADAGFMIVDWYEGNMIYDFERKRIWLFDWDLCRKGDGFTLEMDSNYGSSRLMAPEEFVRDSWLDQRTLVFNLGRYTLLNLPELAEPLAPVLARATYPARVQRYSSIQDFALAFSSAAKHAARPNRA
jgi:serine/threonine-protein kinase